MKHHMSKTLKVVCLLTLIVTIIMGLFIPFILSETNQEYGRNYSSIQEDPYIYRDSYQIVDKSAMANLLYYIDMLKQNKSDRELINAIFEDGDKVSDEKVKEIINELDILRVNNDVYQSSQHYLYTIGDNSIDFGDKSISSYLNKEYTSMDNRGFYLSYEFDDKGDVSLIHTNSSIDDLGNPSTILSNIKGQESALLSNLEQANGSTYRLNLKPITNVRFGIVLSSSALSSEIYADDVSPDHYIESRESIATSNFTPIYVSIVILLIALSFLLPKEKMKDSIVINKLLSFPFFIPLFLIHLFLIINANEVFSTSVYSGNFFNTPIILIAIYISFLPFVLYTIMVKRWIRKNKEENEEKRYLLYEILSGVIDKFEDLWKYMTTIDISKTNNRKIIFYVLCNAFIILCMLFIAAMTGASYVPIYLMMLIVYCVSAFLLLHRLYTKVHKDYVTLNEVLSRAAGTGPKGAIEEDLGVFTSSKASLQQLQDDFQSAVEHEVQSQKMKTELITNVSHDLKTPLTSIISYIDLLKDEAIQEEDREKYTQILETSANRLKHLIENLFEISKANSGNVQIDKMDVDILSLIRQVALECESTFQKKQLSLRYAFYDEKVILPLDSQKTFRIFENLLGNVGKYALTNTRVYISVQDYNNMVEISIKNVSETELNFDPEEIMERFTRGDKSRNSEGSGLGLAIAKSFTELQNGTMKIKIDADLFHVVLRFYRIEEESQETL